MPVPRPVPGLVIRYSYLWLAESQSGREDAAKDRPCAIVLAMQDAMDGVTVTALPITRQPPSRGQPAVELPAATKRRLGLDDARSWVILTEANRFLWPGPDLRPARLDDPGSFAYGLLPFSLFEAIRKGFLAAVRAQRASLVRRTE